MLKKLLIVEIILLAVLLITALVVCIGVPLGAFAPADVPASIDGTGQMTDPAATEPSGSSEPQPAETTEPKPTWFVPPEGYALTAKQTFVYDCETGTYISRTGNENTVYPASVTKLFSAYVALQYLDPDKVITAGDALDMVGAGSSVADIKKGDELTVSRLVEAMLLPSGNDASYILAAEAGRVICNDPSAGVWYAAAEFVDEMNRRAQTLGMRGTHFTNPDGYHDSDHYTTYDDLVTIAKLALENPVILAYAGLSEDVVQVENHTQSDTEEAGATAPAETPNERHWKNTNLLIHEESKYYCPYAIGLKTGQTPSAGSCLLSAFRIDGRDIIIGVFGCPDVEDRFADTLLLLNEALEGK